YLSSAFRSTQEPCRRSDSQASEGLRTDPWPPIRRGRGFVGRRVAEDGTGPRLSSRRSATDSGRANRRTGREVRTRSFPALRRINQGQDGAADFSPLFNCEDGRQDSGAGKRTNCRAGAPQSAFAEQGPLRRNVRAAGGKLSMIL